MKRIMAEIIAGFAFLGMIIYGMWLLLWLFFPVPNATRAELVRLRMTMGPITGALCIVCVLIRKLCALTIEREKIKRKATALPTTESRET